MKKPSLPDVKKAMEYCKIVGITKEQGDLLDSTDSGTFTQKDEAVIDDWAEIIGKANADEAKKSMRGEGGYLRAKENGTAYARLAHLAVLKVEFI